MARFVGRLRGALTGLAGLLACACEPFAEVPQSGEAPIFRDAHAASPPPVASPDGLRIMAWNIKYGAARIPFWFDCWGDRVSMSRGEVDANLDALAALIDEVKPDILLTEEIEVNSRRSAYVDMVQAILKRTDLDYAAYFRTWDSRYIPSEGLGRMDLGNAVFSRFPIRAARSIRQADRTDQDALTAEFYIHRAVGRAEIELAPDSRAAIYVVHTEAYDNDGTKQRQIAQILDLARTESLPFVVGGDFNELPPTALHREGFPDERSTALCADDFKQPPYTPEVMQPFFDELVPALPLQRYGTTPESQRRLFTHSVLGPDEVNEAGEAGFWNRTLDYLFADPRSTWGVADVLQQAGQRVEGTEWRLRADPLRLSDHAPVFGVWRPGNAP